MKRTWHWSKKRDGPTPGDFAVVARRLRYGEAEAAEILTLLEAEARAKPEPGGRIGV